MSILDSAKQAVMGAIVRLTPDALPDPLIGRHGAVGSQLSRIDRAECRAACEQRFSPAAMADGYASAYAALTGRSEQVAGAATLSA